ncbi:hypothetical protein GCM10017774_03210 [Lentzea cavernae]|uniref:Uncharacterized protein n=2 Tax=Lentzea cavernae TaxID=2020703 RepID=A0ABQ3LYQ3_9PSEU|nr:hypothetical protein GCM10017774_03210 [Lentzea cavernae]
MTLQSTARPDASFSASSQTRNLPVGFTFAVDGRLGQWAVDKDYTDQIKNPVSTSTTPLPGFKVLFSRPLPFAAFVYAVSLMPALIALSFWVRTRRRGAGTRDTSAALELASALLALIALRQVFVPTDIIALTRLDFVLGVQLLAVCWLMAVTYVAEPPPAIPEKLATGKPRLPRVRRRLTASVPNGATRRIR